jgi:hypothetical protein
LRFQSDKARDLFQSPKLVKNNAGKVVLDRLIAKKSHRVLRAAGTHDPSANPSSGVP